MKVCLWSKVFNSDLIFSSTVCKLTSQITMLTTHGIIFFFLFLEQQPRPWPPLVGSVKICVDTNTLKMERSVHCKASTET
jgi:hypothetical protein